MKKRKKTIDEKNNHSLPKMKMSCGGKRPTWPLKQKSRAKSGRKMWMAVADEKAGFMCSVLAWPRVPRLDFVLFYKDQGKYPKISTPCQMAQSPQKQCQTWTLISRTFQPTCGGKDNAGTRGENRKSKVLCERLGNTGPLKENLE